MGLNKALMGKTYNVGEVGEITEAMAAAYRDATNAGAMAAYQKGVVPPMLIVRFLLPGLTAPVLDPDLGADLLRLVHGEQGITWMRPLRVGDKISVKSELVAIEEKSSGETARVRTLGSCGDEVVADAVSVVFIRKGRPKGEATPSATTAKDEATLRFSTSVSVDDDQSVRYAAASGDHNPIHTDDAVAKAAGLPGVILHGLCTMAFAHNAIVSECCSGAPEGVESLFVRFKRPVLMNDTLRIDGRAVAGAPQQVAVDVHNQSGVPVLQSGLGVLA